MTIKLFLPKKLFYSKKSCDIYGEIKIGEQNCISYYIISALDIKKPQNADEICEYERDLTFSDEIRHLGHVVNATESSRLHHKDVALVFIYDNETPNIYLSKLTIKPEQSEKVNIFLYNEAAILKLHDLNENSQKLDESFEQDSDFKNLHDICPDDDMHMLYYLLQAKFNFKLESDVGAADDFFKRFVGHLLKFPFDVLMSAFAFCLTQTPFKFLFQYTVMSDYYKEWLMFRKSG